MEKLPHTIICAITELIQHNAQSDCYGSDHSRWDDLQLISCIKLTSFSEFSKGAICQNYSEKLILFNSKYSTKCHKEPMTHFISKVEACKPD